jgi:hypothetical protein
MKIHFSRVEGLKTREYIYLFFGAEKIIVFYVIYDYLSNVTGTINILEIMKK